MNDLQVFTNPQFGEIRSLSIGGNRGLSEMT